MRGIHIFCLTLWNSAAWSKSINDRIIGGQDAKQGQFPYQVVWCEEFIIQGTVDEGCMIWRYLRIRITPSAAATRTSVKDISRLREV